MKPKFPSQIFVSGIDTGIGKTMVSAILAEALHADYWKPVQTGTDETSDSETVRLLLSNPELNIYPETYSFKHGSSPHYAATLENTEIDLDRFIIPTRKPLVVEGAGGLMVPVNKSKLQTDLIKLLGLPVVLVVKNYLGSINHTLLSIQVLKALNIPLTGLVFNGKNYNDNVEIIQNFSQVPVIGHIEEADLPGKNFVMQQAAHMRVSLMELFEL